MRITHRSTRTVKTARTVALLVALGASIAGRTHAAPAKPAPATLIVNGLRSAKGTLMVALFDRAKGFPDDGPVFKTVLKKIPRKGPAVVQIPVADGDYAVAIIHDEDGNGALNTNFIGLPTEGYGFGNNAKPGFTGPPSFKEALLFVKAGKKLSIKMLY